MHVARFIRFVGVVATVLLVAGLPSAYAATRPPTNAAKVFTWGNASVKDEFVGPLTSRWAVSPSGRGLVRNQHGMLTLNTTPTSGTVTATLQGGDRQYGRWEARLRSRQYTTGGTPYTVNWELVPAGGDACAQTISLAQFTIGSSTAALHLRNGAGDLTAGSVMNLSRDVFHTYAVEVAPDHVSWFIDTRVVMTDRRPEARTGATYRMQFRMQAPAGAVMNKSRMQMDWARYYTLDRRSALSIEAPQATAVPRSATC